MLSPIFNFLGFTVVSYEQINPQLPSSRTKTKELRAHAKSQLAVLHWAGMWKRKQEAEAVEAVEAVKFLWKRKQKHFDERDWKRKRTRKRLILSGAGSGSKKFQRWGSGSELGSIKLQELEAEALKIWLLPHPWMKITERKQNIIYENTLAPLVLRNLHVHFVLAARKVAATDWKS